MTVFNVIRFEEARQALQKDISVHSESESSWFGTEGVDLSSLKLTGNV